MWQAGKVTKPEYVRLCNQIYLLELQANKERTDGEDARRTKQILMAELATGNSRSKACNRPT